MHILWVSVSQGPQWTGCCHLSALACLCGWLQALSPDPWPSEKSVPVVKACLV